MSQEHISRPFRRSIATPPRSMPRTAVLAVLTIVALAADARAQTLAAQSNGGSRSGAAAPGVVGASNAASSVHAVGVPGMLSPGDVVRLRIYREPDLSGDYEVNAEGMAVFPKIGPVHVSEMTTDSLQHFLIRSYSEFLRDPAIDVTPLRRITVLGAVKNPGLYPVDPTMSVADAIALAGGPTPEGNQKKLQIIRGGKRQNVTVTVQEQVAATPIRSGDELYVPERSWISRNGYVVGAAIGAATVIATTIITHR